jgi:hypothetical protein
LGGASDAVVEGGVVSVVAAVGVGEEEGVDVAFLEELRKIDPVVQTAFGGGFVAGLFPLAGGEVADC